MVLPEKSIDKIILKGTKVTCISNILTAGSCPDEATIVQIRMLMVKDTVALKNGDKSPRMYLTVLSLLLLFLILILGTVMVIF